MNAKLIYAALIAVTAAFTSVDLQAQQIGGQSHPGADVLSFSVVGGGYFSTSDLGSGTEFDDSGTVGGTATYWAHPNIGVRGNVLWSPPDVRSPAESQLAGQDPNIWLYSGDVVLRMPLPASANMSWYPYLAGGVGGKTYDFETLDAETDFSGNVGVGVELRFGQTGRWGIHTEVRDFISNFDRLGHDETLNDVVWTGGVSVNF